MTISRKIGGAGLIAVGVLSLGLSGCSSKAGDAKAGDTKGDNKAASSPASSAPSMSAADLQKSLAARISTATPPSSITCASDMAGEVGKTTACEVAVNDTTSVQANVTVTKVNGGNIDYEFTPEMTQAQLEKAFSANVSAQVACDGGLAGTVGASTICHVTKDGTTDDTTVSVSKVQGLYMSLSTSPA